MRSTWSAFAWPVVDPRRRHPADSGVPMVVVAPGEELAAERACCSMFSNRARNPGTALQGL